MLESPEEALEYIKPFVPNDMALAKQALHRELNTSPDWVVDGILFLLTNTIIVTKLQELFEAKFNDNHWMKNTIPYILSDDIDIN